jgi:hypothetical protein
MVQRAMAGQAESQPRREERRTPRHPRPASSRRGSPAQCG